MWTYWLLLLCGRYFCNGSLNLAFQRPAILSSTYDDGRYGAERAVDNNTLGSFGIYQNQGLGTCCHTELKTGSVYWEVDLGNNSIITRIVIQYREGYAARFNGYTIEISDQSLGVGTICYEDTVKGNPLTYVEHDCIVIGRYLKYENDHPHAELCNVEAYGCPVNYYGDNCTLPCPTTSNCLTPPCNPDNGTCIGGCQSGYKGIMCDEECEPGTFGSNCVYQCYCRKNPCDKTTGVCTGGCQAGYHGTSCNETCPSEYFGYDCDSKCNCVGTECYNVNGSCVSGTCLPGWTPPSCSQICPEKTFGQNCKDNCTNCRGGGTCNHVTGICDNGCEDGWIGMNCNISCSPGMYGLNCSEECGNCLNTHCNHVDGQCDSCDAGYRGTKCDTKCQTRTFGLNCAHKCGNCRDGVTCDHVTGICNSGCADGWLSSHCNISCNPGMYGTSCTEECGNCLNAKPCYHVDGGCDSCDAGYHGTKCDEMCQTKKYGMDCSQTCGQCLNDTCSPFNGTCLHGCASGFQNSLCTEPLFNPQDPESSSAAIPVVVVLLVVAVLAAVVVIIVIRRKRRNPNANNSKYLNTDSTTDLSDGTKRGIVNDNGDGLYANSTNTTSLNAKLSSIYSVSDDTDEESEDDESEGILPTDAIYSNEVHIPFNTAITITEFTEIVAKKKKEKIFEEEYNQLPVGLQFPHEHGTKPSNKLKNRFLSTFPYDKSRVILPANPGVENSDYINASYIDGLEKSKAYIATQGPKKGTTIDFWRMIWKENVCKIVMVTNLVEGAKTKCEKYWPDTGKSLSAGPLVITSTKETQYASFIKRELNVKHKKGDKVQIVYHYHFTQWPDHGTPDPVQLLHFNSRIEIQKTDSNGPILVHCSAGIGRTGTFIGLHELMKHGRKSESIDVYQYARLMREGRMNMIQTVGQYVCLHDALMEGLTNPNTTYVRKEFPDRRKSLYSDVKPKNETKLWKQYELLRSLTPVYDENCYKEALSKKNAHKNRNTNVLPHNKFRTYLMTFPSESTNYINAVTIPSYISLNGYIATHIPLPHTVEDFWSMVYDHDCYCVVVLDALPEDVTMLPPVNESMHLKYFGLCNEQEFPRNRNITDYDIIMYPKAGSKEEGRKIKMFTIKSIKPTAELFISLCEFVIHHQKIVSESGPVVIACSDGASQCGIFATLITTVQRILMDNDIDIFQAVRTIQQRRPQFSNSFEQYEFIYQLVDTYIDSNELYVNM